MPTAAKKAAANKTTKAEPVQPLTRTAMLARLVELRYDGPTSYTAATLRETVLPWLEAGAPEGDESVPTGVRYAVHPHLRPELKSGQTEARVLVRDLRRAASAVLDAEDKDEAINVVDGLTAQLRELLAAS